MHVFECINLAKIEMNRKMEENMLNSTMECIQFSDNTQKQTN